MCRRTFTFLLAGSATATVAGCLGDGGEGGDTLEDLTEQFDFEYDRRRSNVGATMDVIAENVTRLCTFINHGNL